MPHTPLLIGASQLISRERDPRKAAGPLDMLGRIVREAALDAGGGDPLIQAIDTIALASIAAWSPQNQPRVLAHALGIEPKQELLSHIGGEISLTMLNRVAEQIKRGEYEVALIAGANNLATVARARKEGVSLGWMKQAEGDGGEPERIGSTVNGTTELEEKYGIAQPPQVYPIIENALRARRGRSIEVHRRRLGELMTRFTKVAAQNQYAWFPVERSAEELVTVTEANRMICFPYPKYLNAVLNTDQAAGVILASEAAADRLGIAQEKRIYWWGGAHTAERAWFVSERPAIGTSPALEECARRTFENTGVGIDEIDHIDLYSCFPVAVELGCEAYGIAEDDPRGLTVTGGLPYAGGPANNYPMHSLATMVERLRARPGDKGLVTGNGWYVTKHSANVWSSEPNPQTPSSETAGGEYVGPEPVPIAEVAEGNAVVESYTVVYGRDRQPERGIVLGRLEESGERFVANLAGEPALLHSLTETEAIGRNGAVRNENGNNLLTLA